MEMEIFIYHTGPTLFVYLEFLVLFFFCHEFLARLITMKGVLEVIKGMS